MSQQSNNAFFVVFIVFMLLSCSADVDQKQQAETGTPSTEVPAEKSAGLSLFRQNCITCHGLDGKLGLNGAKDLTQSILPKAERIQIITKGKGMMTPFSTMLSAEQIDAVAEYTLSLKTK